MNTGAATQRIPECRSSSSNDQPRSRVASKSAKSAPGDEMVFGVNSGRPVFWRICSTSRRVNSARMALPMPDACRGPRAPGRKKVVLPRFSGPFQKIRLTAPRSRPGSCRQGNHGAVFGYRTPQCSRTHCPGLVHRAPVLPRGQSSPIDRSSMTIELTIVPAGIDVPPLGLEGPKGPEIRIDFEKLSLRIGE